MRVTGHDEFVIVVFFIQRRGHGLIQFQPAAPPFHDGIMGTHLLENTDRFSSGAADEARIHLPAANVCIAPAEREHLAKAIGKLPGGGERGNPAAAAAADSAGVRVLTQMHVLANLRQDLIPQKRGVSRTQRVVFDGTIAVDGLAVPVPYGGAGVHEHRRNHRQIAVRDEVVEHDREPPMAVALHEVRAILENHQRGGLRRGVLRGDVQPPVVHESRERPGIGRVKFLDLALRHAGLREGVRPEDILRRR